MIAAAFSLVRYDEGADPLASLSRRERASLGTTRVDERAAGLVAARRAVLRLRPTWDHDEVEVLCLQYGPPVVRRRAASTDLVVSVSHAGGLAVAAVSAPTTLAER